MNKHKKALFAVAKEVASTLVDLHYDGTLLKTSDLAEVRATMQGMLESALGEARKHHSVIDDCVSGFRASYLEPSVDICVAEFTRIWNNRMTLPN